MAERWRIVASLLLATACPAAPSPPDAGAPEAKPPPDIVVRADRNDLVYSYASARGYQTAGKIDDIPEEARREVIVTDLSLSPEARQSDRYVYIADLSRPRPDGSYPVAIASRYAFEGTSAVGTAPADAPPAAAKEVIVYTTAWCGVCKRAKRKLTEWGVRFTEKDIEGSKKASEELAEKSARAGLRMGGVPVIDVAGRLMQGFDEASLKATLREEGFL